MQQNKVRIIGGTWRSRVLRFSDQPDLRPTPDRMRETLFNWLQQSVRGKRCLDAYAGTGALGFEALSRGAEHVTMIESNRVLVQHLHANAGLLETRATSIYQGNFAQIVPKLQGQPFDLVLLDPPFSQGLVSVSVDILQAKNLLAQEALIYVETELKDPDWPDWLKPLKYTKVGAVHGFLLAAK